MVAQKPPAPLYTNVKVSQDTVNPFSADAGPAYRLEFDVLGQPGFWVVIPESDFDPDTAEATISQKAAAIAAVMGLAGPTVEFSSEGHPLAPGQFSQDQVIP